MSETSRVYLGGKANRIADYQEIASNQQYHAREKNSAWDVYDSILEIPLWQRICSELLGGDDEDMIGPPPRTFQYSFRSILPPATFTRSLKHYVEDSLHDREGSIIGIELGGTGSQLFEGFRRNFFSKTLGVNLVDTRSPERRKKDERRHHEVIKKDLLDPTTFLEVKQLLHEEKADFIIERMQRAIRMLSHNPYLLTQRFSEWYQLLNDEGIFLAQIPPVLDPIMEIWLEKVKHETNGTIDIVFKRLKNDHSIMRLIKHQGAPESIPVLSPRELRSAYLTAQK